MNVVVVGDSGVGKTSLITTLVSGIFPESVPSTLQQVRIGAKNNSEDLVVLITDTLSDEAERSFVLDRIVRTADVVICVYDVSSSETFEKLDQNWLEPISKLFEGPIILAGNKIDLQDQPDSPEQAKVRIRPLLDKYRIDASLECSARTNVHVSDLFYFAQHAVVYPVHPLMDPRDGSLLPKFQNALTRIFRFFDEDHDDLLANNELNKFQEKCFGARLPNDDIEGIRSVLENESPSFVEEGGVTLKGFMFLFQLFIDRNRPETAWSVLRRFNYDNNLGFNSMSDRVLKALRRDQSLELSKQGFQFIGKLFHQFDRDHDGVLNQQELDDIFATTDGRLPWTRDIDQDHHQRSFSQLADFPDGCSTSNTSGDVNSAGWLAQWAMTACLCPSLLVQQLELLGYPDFDLTSALTITRRRVREDAERKLQRSIIRGFCFGDTGVGKSTLLNALVGKDPIHQVPGTAHRSAASMVRLRDQRDRGVNTSTYLILTELSNEEQLDFFSTESRVDCDVAVLILDSLESIEHLRAIQQSIPETVPCVYITNQRVLSETSQQSATEMHKAAQDLCGTYSISEPEVMAFVQPHNLSTDVWQQQLDRIFQLIVNTALYPRSGRPQSKDRNHLRRAYQQKLTDSLPTLLLGLGLLASASALLVFLTLRRPKPTE